MRNNFNTFVVYHFAKFGQPTVSALLGCKVNQYGTSLHAFQHFRCNQLRRRTPRYQCGTNNNILLGYMLSNEGRLALFIISAHFLGVTAFCFAALIWIGLNHNKSSAQAFNLLFRSIAHVGCADNCTKALCRGDRLQTSNPCTHNKNTSRRNCSGRCHHHWQSAAIFNRRIENCFIAG